MARIVTSLSGGRPSGKPLESARDSSDGLAVTSAHRLVVPGTQAGADPEGAGDVDTDDPKGGPAQPDPAAYR